MAGLSIHGRGFLFVREFNHLGGCEVCRAFIPEPSRRPDDIAGPCALLASPLPLLDPEDQRNPQEQFRQEEKKRLEETKAFQLQAHLSSIFVPLGLGAHRSLLCQSRPLGVAPLDGVQVGELKDQLEVAVEPWKQEA